MGVKRDWRKKKDRSLPRTHELTPAGSDHKTRDQKRGKGASWESVYRGGKSRPKTDPMLQGGSDAEEVDPTNQRTKARGEKAVKDRRGRGGAATKLNTPQSGSRKNHGKKSTDLTSVAA